MSWTAGQFTRWLDAKEAKRQAGRPGNRNGPQSMVLAGETKWRPNTGAGSTAHSQALSGRLAASPSLEARRLPTSQKTNSSPSGARNLLTAPLGYMFCSAPHHISPQGSLEGNVSTSSSLGPRGEAEPQNVLSARSSSEGSLLLSGPTCPDSGFPHPSLL